MRLVHVFAISALLAGAALANHANATGICEGYGPQAPRDIASKEGSNPRAHSIAPSADTMNLCNIHFHTNAEHKGPGFAVFAGDGEHGGFKCNDTDGLTEAELQDPTNGQGVCRGVLPGDTIEVHWVFTTCDTKPGKGLGSCLTDQCANPQLLVESQVFLVANDLKSADFMSFAYGGNVVNGLHQPKALPSGTGDAVVFVGSTTGPKYSEQNCSPLQATWRVRPACAKVSVASLHEWCAGNVFEEDHAHGVRQLVTSPALLSTIE